MTDGLVKNVILIDTINYPFIGITVKRYACAGRGCVSLVPSAKTAPSAVAPRKGKTTK